jgi:hypothetical protein
MNHRRHSRSGAALIIVLVLVLLMGVAAAGFLLSMQTENIAARSSGDLLIAQAAATSGETMLGVLLEAPRQYRDSIGGLGDNPELFAKVAVVELGEDLDESEMATFTVIAPEYRARLQGTGGMSGMGLGLAVNDEALRYGGVDESNKIHLLKVLQWDQQIPGAGRAALLRIPGMTEETADSLLDWVDTDSETREFGAEDEYYSASGIQPRNGRPNSMRELLLVRGISSEAPPSWLSWLTIYSAHRDEAYDGAARVYVNDNNLARLQQSFAERVPLAWAQFVILYRQFGPAPTATDDEPVAPDAIPLDLSQPPRFRIESLIDLVDAKVALNHNGSRVWWQAPWYPSPYRCQNNCRNYWID